MPASAKRAAARPQPAPATRHRGRVLLVLTMIAAPLLLGWWWNRASDNPLWPVFRSSLNWCELREARAYDSPDGKYTAHVVNAVCVGRFPEQMVFLSDRDEEFSASAANPNRAVLEVAGRRTIDAAIWISAEKTGKGRPALQLFLVNGSQHNLHRFESQWRGMRLYLGESQPAEGAERLSY